MITNQTDFIFTFSFFKMSTNVRVTYLVTGTGHDGYCSGAENEELDPYYEVETQAIENPLSDFQDDILPRDKYPSSIVARKEEGCQVEHGSRYCDGEAVRYHTPIKVELIQPDEFKLVEEAKKQMETEKKMKEKQEALLSAIRKNSSFISSRISDLCITHIENQLRHEPQHKKSILDADYKVQIQVILMTNSEQKHLGCAIYNLST